MTKAEENVIILKRILPKGSLERQALDAGIVALEKQVPQSAIGIECWCGYKFENEYNYCPRCGQKMKWRGKDD